jgi:DNA-3-methyladenine glycosylase II
MVSEMVDMASRSSRTVTFRKKAAGRSEHWNEHTLVPRAPFCFRKAREVTSSFSPGQGQVLVNEAVHRPLRIGGRTVLATIVSHGSIEVPRLGITLSGEDELDVKPFLGAVADHYSIDDDLEPLYQKGLEDPLFGMLVARLYGLHQVRFISPFASACWAILSAHTPLGAAVSLQSDLLKTCGDSVAGPDGVLWAYPEPSDILGAGEATLHSVVRNSRKARYLMSSARTFHDVEPQFLRNAAYDEVRAWLMDINGVGPWGASLVMIRGLGRMERLPEKEGALIEAASKAYGRRVTEEDIVTMAERYGQVKAYWAYYLRINYEALS